MAGLWRCRQRARDSGGRLLPRPKLRTALELANPGKASRVLEIGTQYGYLGFRLAASGFEVDAVDVSTEAIELARERAQRLEVGGLRFTVQDAENLEGFEDGVFDAVFSLSCLRYLRDPSKAMGEGYRVAKPGGRFVVDFTNKSSPWFSLVKPLFGIKPHIHDNRFSGQEVADFMVDAGFTDVRTTKLLFTPRKLPGPLLPVFKMIDRVCERIPGAKELAGIVMCVGTK